MGLSAVDRRMAKEDVEGTATFKVIWVLLGFVHGKWVGVMDRCYRLDSA